MVLRKIDQASFLFCSQILKYLDFFKNKHSMITTKTVLQLNENEYDNVVGTDEFCFKIFDMVFEN